MVTDRYDLVLSTASSAARDAYVQASDLALTFFPGAAEAYEQAIAADPRFALAHAGKAQVLMRQGDVEAARASLTAAKEVSGVCPSAKPATSGFSILSSRAEPRRRSLPCTRISRHGRVTRWLFPWPRIPTE
jgi:tetratricopeptide (TPR) repeat protein